MAFVAVTRNDYDRGRYYVNTFCSNFIRDWARLQALDFAGKHLKLQSLQNVSVNTPSPKRLFSFFSQVLRLWR
jgi:hypothetical protein